VKKKKTIMADNGKKEGDEKDPRIVTIIKILEELTLGELGLLIKDLEKTFDIDSETIVGVHVGTPGPSSSGATPSSTPEPVEEKTSFDIVLVEVPGEKKISILKVVRNVTGLGLKESKDIVDNIPKAVKEGISKQEADTIKKELEAAGAKVLLK
jgi:large subunit ribosomal protein L7/L12